MAAIHRQAGAPDHFLLLCCISFFFRRAGSGLSGTAPERSEPHPGAKLKIYDDLSWFYNSVDVQRSVEFGRKGLALAQKSHDLKMEGIFLRNLAVASYMGGKYDPAMGFLEKARPIADKLQDYQLQSSLYNTYANIYLGQSQYDLALENYFAVAKICEEHKDPKKLIIVWSNIGIVIRRCGILIRLSNIYEKPRNSVSKSKALKALAVSMYH